MRPSPTLSTVAVGVFSSLAALAQPPPNTDIARELRARAADHFTHEEYGASYEASAAAYRLEHDQRDACNAGTTARAAADKAAPEERDKRLVEAVTWLALCMEAQPSVPLDDTERARRTKLSAEFEMARQRVGQLELAADEGAELQAGGRVFGRAPLAGPVFVAPGTHTITATRDGSVTTRSITVAPDTRLRVDLRPAPPVAVRSETPRRPDPVPQPRRPLAELATLGQVVAGIAAGVAFVAFASSRVMYANGDASEREAREGSTVYPCDFSKPPQACKDMREARNIAGTLQDAALAGAVVAGIAGAATITVYFADGTSSAKKSTGAILAVGGAF